MINAREIFGERAQPGISSTLEEFETLVNDAERVVAGEDVAPPAAPDVPENWPEPMSEEAFYGLAGDFVRLVLPESEADPHALLLSFLVGFGSMVGRGPHYQVEATRHGVNEFTVVVGKTAKSRKGTSKDRAIDILRRVDPDFMKTQKRSGLSTGEGLIYAIRDERKEYVETKEKDGPTSWELRVVDKGVEDKRLLAIESEFSAVLQVCSRDGNILSGTLRDGWDSIPIGKLARSNKDSCQEPHIAIIANSTLDDVQRHLTTNDKANGFANRFLWCCAKRSKKLPHGGRELDSARLEALVSNLKSALEYSKNVGRVSFDNDAYRRWESVYHVLTEEVDGMFGALTARAEAHVVRLATSYALLDKSSEIKLDHLRAAQEVWSYCEDSVRYIFGDLLGDETADTILRMLRAAGQEGLSQTDISNGFNRHKPAAEISRGLTLLEKRDKITSERMKTDGAPVTRWRINDASAN